MKSSFASGAVVGLGAAMLIACGGSSKSTIHRASTDDASDAGNNQGPNDSPGEDPGVGGSSPTGGMPGFGGHAQGGSSAGGFAWGGIDSGFGGLGIGGSGVPVMRGPDGLRASYSFDEEAGGYATEALSQSRAPIYLATRVEGAIGNALEFGATSARAELFAIGAFPEGELSVELWVRPSLLAPDTTVHLIGDGSGGTESFRVQLRGDKVAFLLTTEAGVETEPVVTSSQSIEIDRWQLVTVTYDGSTARLYLDGVEDAARAVIYPLASSGNTLYVGALRSYDGETFSGQFDGAIDEIKIWDRSLSAETIAEHFDAIE